jgi:3',5'-nucleoside bisphosphate phosphatase
MPQRREPLQPEGISMLPHQPPLTLAADAPVDLQLHTTHSDGYWSAEELIDYVAGERFALVAVTDHDRVDTVGETQRAAARRGVPVLAATELSAAWDGHLLDLLCYGFDPKHNALAAVAETTRRAQAANIQETYAELQRRGYHLPVADSFLAPGTGVPRHLQDLIDLLHKHGYGAVVRDALLGAGFRYVTADPAEIVDAAHRSGAVCIISHPGRGDGFVRFDEQLLDRFREEAAIDGLEVYHPSHTPEQSDVYAHYVRRHDLLASAGSDSHGPPGPMPVKYRAETSRDLLERVGIRVQ